MRDSEIKQREMPLVNFKQLRKFVIYPGLAVAGFFLFYSWIFPAFYATMTRPAGETSLREKAEELGLTYDKVLADRAGAEGKPVIWCVQNRSLEAVTLDGNANKRLDVSNYARMPIFTGSKHESCTRMLLLLEKGAPGRPVTVFFKEIIY
ncbi:MAG: hypothetical protein PHV36_10040 [Elusimicrobiales bacterium]|nr:hypothetical protein [Elusimicrobiales bacterium]